MDEREHQLFHEHGHDDEHSHAHTHPHTHTHSHESKKNVQNRLARTVGHLQHVRKMVDEDEDCSAVLLQLAAVIGSLEAVSKLILTDHFDHCVVDAVQQGDEQVLNDFKKALEKYIR